MTIHPIIAYIITWSAFMSVIWTLFDRASKVVNVKTKQKLTNWLHSRESKQVKQMPFVIAEAFDATFGRKHLSISCFLKSSLVSMSLFIIFGLIAYSKDLIPSYYNIKLFLISGVIYNVLPDYLSLLETRKLLTWMHRATRSKVVFLLLLDIVLTSLIFYIVPTGIKISKDGLINFLGYFSLSELVLYVVEYFPRLIMWRKESIIFSIVFCTMFFTSIWIWLFAAASILMKSILIFNKSVGWLGKYLDYQNNPFQAVGYVAMILFTLIFWLLTVIL